MTTDEHLNRIDRTLRTLGVYSVIASEAWESIAAIRKERAIEAAQYARLEAQAEAFTSIIRHQGERIGALEASLAKQLGLLEK